MKAETGVNLPDNGETSFDMTFPIGPNGDAITFYGINIENGTVNSWSSTIPIDSIIMKGGSGGATIYTYDPEVVFDDDQMHTTMNLQKYGAISHITVCWDYEIIVSIPLSIISATYDLYHNWSLSAPNLPQECISGGELCNPISTDILPFINLSEIQFVRNVLISGTFVLINPDYMYNAEVVNIIATIGSFPLTIGSTCQQYPFVIPKNDGSVTCTFSGSLPTLPPPTDNIVIHVITRTGTPVQSGVGALSGQQIVWQISHEYDACFDLIATYDRIGAPIISTQHVCSPAVSLQPIVYTETFETPGTHCVSDYKLYTNIQSIPPVIFELCYCLPPAKTLLVEEVSLTAKYDRTYIWSLQTINLPTDCFNGTVDNLVSGGDLKDYLNFTVYHTDHNYRVSGAFRITNPDSHCSAHISTVTADNPSISILCPITLLPYILGPNTYIECTFTATDPTNPIPSPININVSSSTESILSGSLSIAITEWTLDSEIDRCVLINGQQQQQVCEDNPVLPSMPVSENYSTSGTMCKYYQVRVISLSSSQVLATVSIRLCYCIYSTVISSSSSSPIHGPITEHCTRTQGYWKTHVSKWPAGLASQPFYMSGVTWIQTYQYESTRNTCYWKVAHQYIAAYLNCLDIVEPQNIVNAMATVNTMYSSHTRIYIDTTSKWCRDTGNAINNLLDRFNSGLIQDAPHCEL